MAAPAGRAIRPTGKTGEKSIMYDWDMRAPVGDYRVVRGTHCVVVIDPAWDEESCSKDRPIDVRIVGGQQKGLLVTVPRHLLRKR